MLYLTEYGLIIPLDKIEPQRLEEIKKKLTYTCAQRIGKPKKIEVFSFANFAGRACIRLPRTFISEFDVAAKFREMRKINLPLLLSPHANQKAVGDYLFDKIFAAARIAKGNACAIVNMPAGSGKTFLAAYLINKLSLRTVYITSKRPLAEQALKDLRKCFGDGAKIVWDESKKPDLVKESDITIININTAVKRDAEFFSDYSFAILDEVHEYCTESRQDIFGLTCLPVALGMSATTEDRSDGFDKVAHIHLAFDGVIRGDDLAQFSNAGDFKIVVNAIHYYGDEMNTENLQHPSTGLLFTPYMHNQFLQDQARNDVFFSELKSLFDWRGPNGEMHYIYIFCEKIQPLREVFPALRELYKDSDFFIPEIGEMGEFIGGINSAEIAKIRDTSRIILTTYGYGGTGVSIDKMTAIMFLTPRRAKMLQIVGRILRRSGNRSITRRIVDIIDENTALRQQFEDRETAYYFYGARIDHYTARGDN